MSLNLRDLSQRSQGLVPGHRACAGCGFPTLIRMLLATSPDPPVVVNATGCLEVVSSIYPYSAWPVPWMHNAFENAAATACGVRAAAVALHTRGRLDRLPKVVAIGGDGGTYDIGLQSLSGAIERGTDLLYICYNNEGYMNTGMQRSSATPRGARTSTSPVGARRGGKPEPRKDMTEIVAAHGAPYVAQASISHWGDLGKKLQKALATAGPAFLNVLTPCQPGWDYPPEQLVEIAKIAVETRYWPLYEVDRGAWRINYAPRDPLPLKAFLEMQGRFRHLLGDEQTLAELQSWVDANWERLQSRARARSGADVSDAQPKESTEPGV